MEFTKKILDQFIKYVGCILFISMILVAAWQVLSRFIFGSPSSFSEEFLRYALIWVSMLGAAYAVGSRSHVAITLLKDKLTGNSRFKLEIVLQIIFLLFAAIVMVFGGAKAVSITMEQHSASMQIPMGYIYLSLPVSGIIAIFYSIYNIKILIDGNKLNN